VATDLIELRAALDVELGSQGLPAATLDPLLIAGVGLYNGEASQEFEVTGTALDRVASSVEKRALVLQALLAYLNGKLIMASENAVSISNPAGKTDLTSIEWALAKRRKEMVDGQLKIVMDRIKSPGVMSEVFAHEMGETLPPVAVTPWPW